MVAREVKGLANQTTFATEEVARKIGDIQNEIDNSVAATLHICKTIGAMDETSQAITLAVEQQRAANDEISKNAQLTANETQLVSSAIQENSSETAAVARRRRRSCLPQTRARTRARTTR